MAATAPAHVIPVSEYLGALYHPDMDYVDGVLEERNLGEVDHADLQSELVTFFRIRTDLWQVRAFTEARVQVAPNRFRIPDVCVMPSTWKRTRIVREAPLLCLEVKSPEFTLKRECSRAKDYLQMGVPEVWIFDPESRTAYVMRGETITEHREGTLRLAGTAIEIVLADLFRVLDL